MRWLLLLALFYRGRDRGMEKKHNEPKFSGFIRWTNVGLER